MRTPKKLVAVLAASAMALTMFGCSGTQEEETVAEPDMITSEEISAQEIQIKQTGYSLDDQGNINYAIIANNPNEGYIANSVMFSIEGYDENDRMLLGTAETIMDMYPGVDTGVVGTAHVVESDLPLVRFEVSASVDLVNWTETDLSASEIEDMFTVDTQDAANVDGTTTISGTLSADVPDAEEATSEDEDTTTDRISASVVAILQDADGKLICGGDEDNIIFDMPMVIEPVEEPVEPNDAELVSGEGAEEADENADENAEEGEEGDEATAESEEPVAEEAAPVQSDRATASFSISIPNAPSYARYILLVVPAR